MLVGRPARPTARAVAHATDAEPATRTPHVPTRVGPAGCTRRPTCGEHEFRRPGPPTDWVKRLPAATGGHDMIHTNRRHDDASPDHECLRTGIDRPSRRERRRSRPRNGLGTNPAAASAHSPPLDSGPHHREFSTLVLGRPQLKPSHPSSRLHAAARGRRRRAALTRERRWVYGRTRKCRSYGLAVGDTRRREPPRHARRRNPPRHNNRATQALDTLCGGLVRHKSFGTSRGCVECGGGTVPSRGSDLLATRPMDAHTHTHETVEVDR